MLTQKQRLRRSCRESIINRLSNEINKIKVSAIFFYSYLVFEESTCSGYTYKLRTERACSLVDFEPACSLANQRVQLSISNQRVRLSILNQCFLSSIATFLKTSDQRIEQITITHLLIAQRIVLELQRCVIKTTHNLDKAGVDNFA